MQSTFKKVKKKEETSAMLSKRLPGVYILKKQDTALYIVERREISCSGKSHYVYKRPTSMFGLVFFLSRSRVADEIRLIGV